jgi:hypothetical protein
MLTESEIRQAALEGLRGQIRVMLAEQRWGPGQRLNQLVSKCIEESLPTVERQIGVALVQALQSPEFVAQLRVEMTQAMRNKFAGAFHAVMHSAGKRAAQDRLIVEAVVRGMAESLPKQGE